MKYTIDIPYSQVAAIDTIALFDSEKDKVVTHEMAIRTAIDIFLRIRHLSTEDQKLIASLIEKNK